MSTDSAVAIRRARTSVVGTDLPTVDSVLLSLRSMTTPRIGRLHPRIFLEETSYASWGLCGTRPLSAVRFLPCPAGRRAGLGREGRHRAPRPGVAVFSVSLFRRCRQTRLGQAFHCGRLPGCRSATIRPHRSVAGSDAPAALAITTTVVPAAGRWNTALL